MPIIKKTSTKVKKKLAPIFQKSKALDDEKKMKKKRNDEIYRVDLADLEDEYRDKLAKLKEFKEYQINNLTTSY